MKKILIILITGTLSFHLAAQTEKPDSIMQLMEKILLEISESGDEFNESILNKYGEDLKGIRFEDLDKFNIADRYNPEGNKDSEFTIHWKNVIDSINKEGNALIITGGKVPNQRGSIHSQISLSAKNKYFTQRIKIKAGQSFKTSFREQGRFQLLAVAEKGGLVTTKLHAHDSRSGYDKHFDDTDKFHQGKNVRNTSISLPDKYVDIDVEILNRADHDITCVLVFK